MFGIVFCYLHLKIGNLLKKLWKYHSFQGVTSLYPGNVGKFGWGRIFTCQGIFGLFLQNIYPWCSEDQVRSFNQKVPFTNCRVYLAGVYWLRGLNSKLYVCKVPMVLVLTRPLILIWKSFFSIYSFFHKTRLKRLFSPSLPRLTFSKSLKILKIWNFRNVYKSYKTENDNFWKNYINLEKSNFFLKIRDFFL